MVGSYLDGLRKQGPLIHCMVNLVTANDCANLVLASGASPIMGLDQQEAPEITEGCHATVLNLGTPSPEKLRAMLLAGKKASSLGLPTVFDPAGVGASQLRREGAAAIMTQVSPTVIRGNAGEIHTLLTGAKAFRGVDTDPSLSQCPQECAKELAMDTGSVVILSGPWDIVTDGITAYRVFNGSEIMAKVTGMGCQLSCLVGCFLGAHPDAPLEASLAAVCAMGLCGQIAAERMEKYDGNATFRNYLIDAMYHLSGEALEKGARYEIF